MCFLDLARDIDDWRYRAVIDFDDEFASTFESFRDSLQGIY